MTTDIALEPRVRSADVDSAVWALSNDRAKASARRFKVSLVVGGSLYETTTTNSLYIYFSRSRAARPLRMRCCGAAAALGFIAAAAYAGTRIGAQAYAPARRGRVVGRKVGAKEVGGKKVRTVKSPHTTQI